MGILYLIPFLLIQLFNHSSMKIYFAFGAVPLAIYIILFLTDWLEKIYHDKVREKAGKVLFWGVISYIFLSLGSSAYKLTLYQPGDCGIKAMGFYVRNYVSKDLSIFVPESYLQPLTLWYYFGREVKYHNYQDEFFKRKDFQKDLKNVDIVVTQSWERYSADFSDFELKAKVIGNVPNSRGAQLSLYARKQINLPFINMPLSDYNVFFDKNITGILRNKTEKLKN